MAILEDISLGKIVIGNEDRNVPHEVGVGSALQVPFFDNVDARLLISHHGNPLGKWFEVTSGTIVSLKSTTFIMCKYSCVIALWE